MLMCALCATVGGGRRRPPTSVCLHGAGGHCGTMNVKTHIVYEHIVYEHMFTFTFICRRLCAHVK